MILHTVAFRLRHAAGSPAEAAFLERAAALGGLPGVGEFRVLRQVGEKNDFDWGLSMRFDSREAYAAYDAHPEHRRFVEEVWLAEVEDFLELDYVAHGP